MKTRDNPKAPSAMFVDSISSGGGSHDANCGYCGRQHYCPDSSNFYHNDYDSDDEDDAYANYLKDALAEQKADPDGVVIHHGVDFVEMKDLNDITFVVECPCNGLTKYEEFIWSHRRDIMKYLHTRTEEEKRWAEEQKTVDKLVGVKK